jgi:hypothetical protein
MEVSSSVLPRLRALTFRSEVRLRIGQGGWRLVSEYATPAIGVRLTPVLLDEGVHRRSPRLPLQPAGLLVQPLQSLE